MPSVLVLLKKGTSAVTTIIFDKGALITDSRVMTRMPGTTNYLSRSAGKIHYNESRTIAWAAAGPNMIPGVVKEINRLMECSLIITHLIELSYRVEDLPPVFKKMIKSLTELQGMMLKKNTVIGANDVIAMSRDNVAYRIDDSIMPYLGDGELGIGMYCDSYWLWRHQGLTPSQVFAKLNDVSELSGGPANVALMKDLNPIDYKQFFNELTSANSSTLPPLQAEVKPPVKKQKKG